MIGTIVVLIFFIIIIAACCAGDSDTPRNNTAQKRNTNTSAKKTTYYSYNTYSECPSCGAPYYDGYCEECGYPDINQGWLGEEY